MTSTYAKWSVVALSSFVIVLVAAILVYFSGSTVHGMPAYNAMLLEDGPVEWANAALLFIGAILSLRASAYPASASASARARIMLLVLSAFLMLCALEEISWGQRIFGIESSDFFKKYNGQGETNIHNMVQLYLKERGFHITKTREFAALILGFYGLLPALVHYNQTAAALIKRLEIIVPAPALTFGFVFGAFLCWFDWPTGQEEELGELLFSMAFAWLVPLWHLQQNEQLACPRLRGKNLSDLPLPPTPHLEIIIKD